jgi:hypothetical protein
MFIYLPLMWSSSKALQVACSFLGVKTDCPGFHPHNCLRSLDRGPQLSLKLGSAGKPTDSLP